MILASKPTTTEDRIASAFARGEGHGLLHLATVERTARISGELEGVRRLACAYLARISLGDRFRPWRDFALRVRGDAALALRAAIGGGGEAARAPGIELVANVVDAARRRFEVRAAFERLVADPRNEWLRVAMAYIDGWGARLLDTALARGARVELIVPARANVYQNSNMRALARLLRARPALRILGCRSMLHAKALLAGDARGPRVAFVGSANLKRNSLDRFGELNALVTDEVFLAAFAKALDALAAESDPISRPRYRLFAALVEESFG